MSRVVGAIYGVGTGRLRRYVIAIDEPGYGSFKALQRRFKLGKGEAMLDASALDDPNPETLQQLITEATGKTPGNDRYVLIDLLGFVVAATHACTHCDDLTPRDGHKWVRHQSAGPGWQQNKDGSFIDPASTDALARKVEIETRLANGNFDEVSKDELEAALEKVNARIEAARAGRP